MLEIESIFVGENPSCLPSPEKLFKAEIPKVGEIFRLDSNNLTLKCDECSSDFTNFAEFVIHIEEHFVSSSPGSIFPDPTEEEPESIIPNDIYIKTECNVDDYCNDPEDPALGLGAVDIGIEMKPNDTEVHDEVFFSEGFPYKKTGEGYECLKCGAKFQTKKYIKKHVTIHKTAKNIVCPICMKGFTNATYVRKHVLSFHKQNITTDEVRQAQDRLTEMVNDSENTNEKLNLLSSNFWRTEGKQYHCPLCIRWFSVPKYVQRHIRLNHGRQFTIEEVLDAQIQQNGSEEVEVQAPRQKRNATGITGTKYECFDCHRPFVSVKALKYHLLLHEAIEYACPFCEKYFSMPKYVRDHLTYKHGFDKRSKMPELKSRAIENFKYHKPTITAFECYLCKRSCSTRSKLRSHMLSHTDVLKCKICEKIFQSNESRRRHMELHRGNEQHQCGECNKIYPLRRYLMSHMRTSHKNSKPKIIKEFPCPVCKKVFKKLSLLNKHSKVHNKQPKKFICDLCGLEFDAQRFLNSHFSTVHKINKRFFKCSICLKRLPKKSEVDHMKHHRGQRDHQCELCGSQYVTKSQLEAHKNRKHIDQRTFSCEICNACFKEPKKLLIHRRTHSEEMQINCIECNLGFLHESSLRKHVQKKHSSSKCNLD